VQTAVGERRRGAVRGADRDVGLTIGLGAVIDGVGRRVPLALAVQESLAPALPGDTVRFVGPLGTEEVAGVTVSWSTRERP
jgi:hypothetical protein